MKKIVLVAGVAAVWMNAAVGAVLDEAKFWWKFDNGGANGAVVQTSEIHDCRDTSVGAASRVCGPSGGPIWTNMSVRLPYRQQTVQCSALNIQVITNASKQIRPSMVDISNGYVNNDEVTFFARICPGDTFYSDTTERFIYNNNFQWGSAASSSYGQLFGFARKNATTYNPRFFLGQANGTMDNISLEVGKWYDLAFSISVVTGATQRVLCVVAGENGLFYQTIDRPLNRQVAFAGTTGRIGGQSFVNSWQAIGSVVNCKDYNGLIHEMALWDRALNLGEILDAFGRPEAPPDGDVFTDVFRWWKFDRDLDDDGKVSANELRDVRKWGTAATPAAGNPEVEFVTDGGPLTWRNMPVYKPARGETVAADCLVMEPEYQTLEDGSFQCWCPHVRFKDSTVAGDATFIARICLTKAYDFINEYKPCYIFHNSFGYGTSANAVNMGGYQFGIASVGNSTTNFCPLFYGGRSSVSVSSLDLTTNTWYDIAYSFSVQTNGKDRLTVTIADAAHGIRTWTGTIATSQRLLIGKTLMLNGENDFRSWATYTDGAGVVKNTNALKNFTGAISQIAIWRRVLTKDEVAAAFGYPRAAFGVGTADGAAGEFATAAEGSYEYAVSDTWHDMAGTLDATHRTLTLRFTPPPSWNGMDQGFHLAAGNVAGADAQVSLTVNGAGFGAHKVATGSNLWWIVKGGAIRAGENVAVLRLSGEGASLAIDKIEMLGSWAVVSGVGGSFTHEGEIAVKDYYVGDRDMTHIARAVTSGNPSNRLHFWLPAWLAENFPFTFTFRTIDNQNSSAAFAISINGTDVFNAPNGLINAERKIELAPGLLHPGWNVIEPRYLTGGGAWVQWSRYSLEVIGPELGTFILLR